MRQGPERARVPAPIPAQLPVFEHKGQLVADSREVAALIERPHYIVLRTIRAMFLYFKGRGFVCRGCARLNYHCQQRTKDSINYAQDGLKLAREKLHWKPPIDVGPMDFPYITPGRPKGMHWATYHRYLAQ